jgi:molybdopterin synthase catalytic subunit
VNFITTLPIIAEEFFFLRPDLSSGGLSMFFGIVRNHHQGRAVRSLFYECYVSMANNQIERIRKEIKARMGLSDIHILHRIGHLEVGEIALAVSAASAHRAEAFTACEEVVERIKKEVPIWKKEFYADGTHEWVRCHHENAVECQSR